ncbi:LysR family transcriptional regulator [Amorphoplanes digitatis]|uniref:DNA-binding transcriptional LysR family regulator n=1 Tax=Actinoplanes digitatis TaxID=1868 RepID=A0A7W7HWD6_9ACTN|nr:LysR family transcriptional regulator [Actinoplanes digitatis]MBB4761994.1 DNA-binding transcriptional LysR family regulator [Actinoplanes digitatis]GID91107.1 LysR family transcriptional regulator [Actinoplanes digitatis]
MDLDLDLGLVRAFVVTAEELHFGRASQRLGVSQQALSKRIARLEEVLDASLFERSTRTTGLTESGRRFLGPAGELLAAGDAAVASVRRQGTPLRIDVLHDRLGPVHLITTLTESNPGLRLELSARRGLNLALPALRRSEIDAVFGRVSQLVPATGLDHTLVRLEPLVAIVAADHPLARHDAVSPAALREYGVWVPNPGSAVEWAGYVQRFTGDFGIPLSFEQVDNVSADQVLRRGRSRGQVFLSAADVANPDADDLRAVSLVEPRPVYPWSLLWRGSDRRRLLHDFIALLDDLGTLEGWRAYTLSECWLPDEDRAALAG